MIDFSKRILLVLDIDGTQLREDVSHEKYSEQDLAEINQLKGLLDGLAAQPGVVLMHATNRMRKFYEADHGTMLAMPHYVACSASTDLLKVDRETGAMTRDANYKQLVDSTGFDAALATTQGLTYAPGLTLTHADNQTDRKVSLIFDPALVPVERRKEIFEELKAQQKPGTSVFMVEDPQTHIIDFVPSVCTKLSPIECVAGEEGIPPGNVIVIGNSNNDIPMCQGSFNCAAVGNARTSLKEHIAQLQHIHEESTGQYYIAQEPNARGVMQILHHFGLA